MHEEPANAIFRFAPSPNGYLHRGHALSALLNFDAANHLGGVMLLRIDDIDVARARPEFENAIFEDLAWLGLRWPDPVLRQSDRIEHYRLAINELDRLGLVYPAFLSRKEINRAIADNNRWPRDPDGSPLYPGPERDWSTARRRREIGSGNPFALRLDLARALSGINSLTWTESDPLANGSQDIVIADPSQWGDIVLAGRETAASYHLSVCIDDADQNVTHILRGVDLRPATSVHRLLQILLRLTEPSYWHHRLVLDSTGKKLSKSDGAQAIRALREAGRSPADIRAGVGL